MKKTKITDKSRVPSPFDTTIHKTERAAVAIVMHWMREIITNQNLPIGMPDVETTSVDRKSPDIVIYERPTSQKALCLIEFKQPYFDVFNEKELKEPAREKATNRKAKYFATSNFQKLIWYNTERVNSFRPEEEQIHDKYLLSQIENLDLIEEPKYRNSIISALEGFLVDLYEVHTGKKPEPKQAIDELLIFRLQEKINRLSRYYKNIIEDKAHKDSKFSLKLQKWFLEQNWSFGWQEEDFLKAARQTAYLLINKILFYNLLQVKRPSQLDPLNIPDDLSKGGMLQRQLQTYFDYVLKEIDYETIYSADFIDQTAFPDNEEVVEEIKELVQVLKRYDFSRLGYDIIGRIFEGLIPIQERHNLGQYFTNPDVVDLILRFCLRHEDDKVFDPACGAGTFLVRAYQHKKLMNQRLSHQQNLNTLWGCDIAKFPAHLSTINLAINDLGVDENYPQIIREDFFSLRLGGRQDFKKEARKRELVGLGLKKISIPYPRIVDCVIGNPPYTRQEEIPSISGDEGYKKRLISNALYDGNKKIANISRRAGIHAYFFIHGTKFLQNGGRFGFIVSNSWLDVDYGKGLQEFFLKNYRIIAIVESKIERWFPDADVNTSIVILEKCAGDRNKKERDENLVRFIYLFKPLRYFIPPAQDMWEKQVNRLKEVDKLKRTVLAHSEFYQNEELRIFPKLQTELWEEGFDKGKKKYVGAKWGKYIRAPEVFFKVLEKGKDKLVPLKEVAEVRRGFTTGANEFFYLTEEEIKRRGIEKEFWMHKHEKGKWVPNYILKSFRETPTIGTRGSDLKHRILLVNKNKEKLRNTRVLKYLREGETRRFGGKIPASTVTCKSRGDNWYALGKNLLANVFYPRRTGDRFLVPYSKQSIFSGDNLFPIRVKNREYTVCLGAYLNSTVVHLFNELSGRQLTGALNVVDMDVWMAKQIPTIDPNKISPSQHQRLEKEFTALASRPIEHILKELGAELPPQVTLAKVRSDRRQLDEIIMGKILGLTKEEQLEVYRAVVDLVKSRIEKAKSVQKRRRAKEGLNIDLLIKTVMENIGSETLGKFYQEKILSQKVLYSKTLPEPTDEIKVERDLYAWRLYSGRRSIECKSESEAQYLKVWLSAGLTEIKVPGDEKYLKRIVPELVAEKKKIDKIINSYLDSILDIKLRARILRQLWQEITKKIP